MLWAATPQAEALELSTSRECHLFDLPLAAMEQGLHLLLLIHSDPI